MCNDLDYYGLTYLFSFNVFALSGKFIFGRSLVYVKHFYSSAGSGGLAFRIVTIPQRAFDAVMQDANSRHAAGKTSQIGKYVDQAGEAIYHGLEVLNRWTDENDYTRPIKGSVADIGGMSGERVAGGAKFAFGAENVQKFALGVDNLSKRTDAFLDDYELAPGQKKFVKGTAGIAATYLGARVVGFVGDVVASSRVVNAGKVVSAKPLTPVSAIIKKPVEWTAPVGTQQTYKVYQRNDIDWNMVRTSTKGPRDFIGKTNEEAARAGFAAELADRSFATLHHINQDGMGKLVEASTRYHGVGKPGQNALHSIWGKNKPHPTNPIDRPKFAQDSKAYWKWRVENES